LQTYQSSADNYTFHDKYFGRNLNDTEAADEIEHFFHNGVVLRADVIRSVISKLDHLHDVLISQTELYFHSASLLLLYDGATKVCSESTQTSNLSYSGDTDQAGSHTDTIDKSQHSLQSGPIQSINGNEPLKRNNENESDVENNKVSECCGCNTGSTLDKPTEQSFDNESGINVDVKLIDFAHVSENPTKVIDCSITFGLKNMKDILEKLLE